MHAYSGTNSSGQGFIVLGECVKGFSISSLNSSIGITTILRSLTRVMFLSHHITLNQTN